MKIFRDFDSVDEIVNPVVTLGSFDGIHSGHRQILNGVIAESKRIKGQSVVITFDPHPRQVIFPDQKMELLTTTEEKAELLERFGIDILLVVEFNETFRLLSSEDFVRNFLVGKLGMKSMVIGYNHHFGHNRSGNFDHLAPLHNELNFNLTRVDKFDMGCGKISSTEIRKLLAEGEVSKAAKLLDYQYFIIGKTDSAGQFTPNSPNKIIPGTGLYEIDIDNHPHTLTINENKQMVINALSNSAANKKITFKAKIG